MMICFLVVVICFLVMVFLEMVIVAVAVWAIANLCVGDGAGNGVGISRV